MATNARACAMKASTVKLDAYVVDVLMPDLVGHDRHPGAFLVFLYFWRCTAGGRSRVSRSLNEIAEGTGLSKRAVQSALKRLVSRRLVRMRRDGITAVPEYEALRPWDR